MAVLPGVLGGVDDAPLLRVSTSAGGSASRSGATPGVWSYGARGLPGIRRGGPVGSPARPGSLPWGTMFCPSKPRPQCLDRASRSPTSAAVTTSTAGSSTTPAITSPGHAQTLAACGCADCAAAARERGVDLDDVRETSRGLADDLRGLGADYLLAISRGRVRSASPASSRAARASSPGSTVRAAILADAVRASLVAAVADRVASARRLRQRRLPAERRAARRPHVYAPGPRQAPRI